LIHDHPPPETDTDKDYERTRFTKEILKRSAEHLERKYGFKFWSNGVEHWLEMRHAELSLHARSHNSSTDETLLNCRQVRSLETCKEKPKISLIIDSESWAFANIAKQIVKYLSDDYEFQVIPTEIVDNLAQIFMMTRDCDITHFFWREYLRVVEYDFFEQYVAQLGYTKESFFQKYINNRRITTAVYDHLFLDNEQIEARKFLFNDLTSGYTVSSKILWDLYTQIDSYRRPDLIVEDGVDLSLFQPFNIDRFEGNVTERPLVIGWAGNSKWGAERGDPKGFHEILLPVVQQLKDEGLNITTHFADRHV